MSYKNGVFLHFEFKVWFLFNKTHTNEEVFCKQENVYKSMYNISVHLPTLSNGLVYEYLISTYK